MSIQEFKKSYFNSITQLLEGISNSSDVTYISIINGRYYWQQCLHALMGSFFWFRIKNEKFVEPFLQEGYYPEFTKEPLKIMPKQDLIAFLNTVKDCAEEFFNHDDVWLLEDNVIYPKYTNLKVALMQIRHITYHVGYLSACLMNIEQVKIEWVD